MKYPVDVKIADYFRRFFQYYIRKRTVREEIIIEESDDEKWNNTFEKNKTSFVYSLSDSVKINLYKDSFLCKLIYTSFEEAEIKFLKKFLRKGDCFFDIGANIGLFSLNASPIIGIDGEIFAFEPTPITFNRLNENVLLNEFNNIKTENIGLSDVKGELEFHTANNGYDALNSIVKLSELGDDYSTIVVKADTIDNFIKSEKIGHIDLMKIDVEGWELNVAKGAKKLFSMPDAPVLMVEFTETNAFAAGYYLGELYDYIKSFGYTWYTYNAEENVLNLEEKKLHYPYNNLIAIKDLKSVFERLGVN